MLSKFRLFQDVTINENTLGMLNYEYFRMKVTLLTNEIARLDKKIKNENGMYSDSAIEDFKKAVEIATKNLEVAKANVETLPQAEDYVTRTLLRLEACQVDSAMLPLAIELTDEEVESVENSMGAYHVLGNGNKKTCDKVLKDLINKILKVETEGMFEVGRNYRCNAEMLRKLHETYVKGLAFNGGLHERKNANGDVELVFSRKESTLYGSIVTKKGDKVYQAFARDLAVVCIDSINAYYNKNVCNK